MSENVPSFLIVDDSPSIREIAGLFISSEYENPITYAPDGELALEEIKKAPENILAVISDDNMPILTGSQLYDHLRKDYDPRLPFLLISADPYGFEKEAPQSTEDKNFGVVTKPFLKRTLLTHLSLLLSEKSHSLITNPVEYRMISIPHFLSFNTLTVSVFIKLSAEKFVKVANPENKSYKAILVPYQEKGIQSVYLLNHDYEQFLEGAIDQINANFKNDSLNRVKMLSLQKESVTKIHEGLATLGIKEKSIKLANATINSTIETFTTMNSGTEVMGFIKKIIGHKNFIQEFALTHSYLSLLLAREMPWGNDQYYHSLVQAALLQDISLRDEKYVRIRPLQDPLISDLSDQEKLKVFQEPKRAAEILLGKEKFSRDTIGLISSCHERPLKRGFPASLEASQLSSINCLFIFAHEFAYRNIFFETGSNVLEETRELFKDQYSMGNFKTVFEAFNKIFMPH